MRWRPSLSPRGAEECCADERPTIAAVEISPVSTELAPRSCLISGFATPMMKKSKPSSMIPKPPKNQNVTCSFDIFALSSALADWNASSNRRRRFRHVDHDGESAICRQPEGPIRNGCSRTVWSAFPNRSLKVPVVTTLNVREARRA